LNCGTIVETLADTHLFGHERGSFTGAVDQRKGYFSAADGGTIFLDEIAELPLKTQVRLLRILETGEFFKVGSSKTEKTNVRMITASHKNLQQEIEKGHFREDLYYRLNTVTIFLPPLRERGEDIYLLFRKFANDFSEKYKIPTLQLTDDAVLVLLKYPFPGNVRQLRNLVEQMTVLEKDRKVSSQVLLKYLPYENPTHFPMLMRANFGSMNGDTAAPSMQEVYKMLQDLKKDTSDIKQFLAQVISKPNLSENKSSLDLTQEVDLQNVSVIRLPVVSMHEDSKKILSLPQDLSLETGEKGLIAKALKKHKGKRKYAADELGISERTLYRKIKELGIDG
jgi:DNA-binding NtrC family response regulator